MAVCFRSDSLATWVVGRKEGEEIRLRRDPTSARGSESRLVQVRAAAAKARSRVLASMVRTVLARRLAHNRSPLSMLPAAATAPLRRKGFDPVDEVLNLIDTEPISKLKLPFGVNVWLVTGYEQAKQIVNDVERFSNDLASISDPAIAEAVSRSLQDSQPGGLGMADAPDHTRLRKMLTPEFTMRRLARLTPMLTEIIEGQLDTIAEAARSAPDGIVDLVQLFALPIPSLAICELLGVPYSDRSVFHRLSVARFDLLDGAGASLAAVSESLDYLLDVVRQQRRDPGDGLLGMIIREHGDSIDDRELAGLADGILVGGFETTASMIGLGAAVLLNDPEVAELVRSEPDAVGPFVEEALRYMSVVQLAFPRFARQDVEVDGTPIAAGDVVLVSLSGANRDPALVDGDSARVDEPGLDVFAPRRIPTHHLAFGYGPHRCVGAELGRLELRLAYPALVRRFPHMRLATDIESLSSRQTSIVFGVGDLPVRVGDSVAPVANPA